MNKDNAFSLSIPFTKLSPELPFNRKNLIKLVDKLHIRDFEDLSLHFYSLSNYNFFKIMQNLYAYEPLREKEGLLPLGMIN